MKKLNFIFSLFALVLFATLFSSFSPNEYPDNPPNGYTGSGSSTCANCHNGGSFGGVLLITGVPATIAPSTTYSISVVLSKTSGLTKKSGFQLNVKNGAGTVTGTLTALTTNVKVESAQYIEHSETSTAQNFNSASGPFSKTWTFNWTSPATTTNNAITFYTCGVIADDGNDTAGDEVLLKTAVGTFTPAAGPLTVTEVTKTAVTCFGGSNGTATVIATGGSGCTNSFLWSNGQTSAIATGLSAGTYTVTATCGASVGTKSVTITQPTTALAANTTGSTLACFGGTNGTASVSASGGGTSYTYLWSNGQTGANATNLSAGTYNVTVSDNNACTLIKSVAVNNPTGVILATTIAPTSATCIAGGTATANASGGASPYTYLWSNAQTTGTITGLTPGNYLVTVTDNNGCKTAASTNVGINNMPPSATISGTSILTCAQATTSLAAPAGSYTYLWSDNATSQNITASNAGTYVVTVTNTSNGCTATSSKVVTENKTPPTVNITGNLSLTCSQPTSTISTSGGSNYQWTGAGITTNPTNSAVIVNAAGTYSVIVTSSSNGCTGTGSANITSNITQLTVPNISPANPTISCGSNSVSLSSSASANYTHQWFLNGNVVANGTPYNASQAGTYTLVITDPVNGCSTSTTSTVTSTKITLTPTATGGKITCTNPSVALNVTAPGAVSYNWAAANFSSSQQNPVVTNPGTYTVIVTDGNGCTGSAQATVLSDTQKPTINATVGGTLSCVNPAVSLNATSTTSGLTYSWLGNSGFSASGSTVSTQQSGVVTVTATNPTNGCTASAIVTVTASNDKPIVATETGTITCKDTVVLVKANVTGNTTGLTYKWAGPSSFTNTTASANVKKAGAYTVTVTASNGCSTTATVTVAIDNQPIVIEITKAKSFICAGDSIRLTAKSIATIQTYTWSNASAKNEIIATKEGTYSLTVSGVNGCKGTATSTLAKGAQPTISLLADSLTCKNSKVKINATVTWQTPTAAAWTGANGFTSSILQPEITQKGTYKIVVTPTDGCSASAEITVKENKTAPTVKIAGEFINCDSMPVTLLATSTATNFVWSGFGVANNTSATVTAAKSGRYFVTSTGSNGCIGKDSAEVKLFPAVLASASTTSCAQGTPKPILLSISGGKKPYEITDSSGVKITGNAVPFKLGLLPIVVKDGNGCQVKINSISVALSLLSIDKNATVVKNATVGQSNGSITLVVNGDSPNLKYLWSIATITKNLTNVQAGTYCVTITDGLGCQVTECFTVKSVVSTEDNLLAQAIQVYPNPVNELLTIIVTENADIQSLVLLNDKGQLIRQFEQIPTQLDMSLLPQGIYFLKINNDKGEWAMKRVIKM
jgi:hypothetical protein